MNRLISNLTVVISFVILLSSCNAHKKLVYMPDAKQLTKDELAATIGGYEPQIMPHDIISISVVSEIPGAAADFNQQSQSSTATVTGTASATTANNAPEYVVSKDGYIDFPVLGNIKVSGMTTKEAGDLIVSKITPRYISTTPIVNIRFQNYKVTVLGEVASPGIYALQNGQMTVLDALAAAGDMTIYGKRNDVMLIRTQENGELSIYTIDMQDKNLVLNKDLYYMQQNDKLYVHTNRAKGNNSSFGTVETIGISSLSLIISIISIITR